MFSNLAELPTKNEICFECFVNLSLVCGPMFAGKTSQLIADYRKHLKGGTNPIVFAPAYDTRHKDGLHSHDGVCIEERAIHRVESVDSVITILRARAHDNKAHALLFDEAQFFHAPMFTGDLLRGLRAYCAELHTPHGVNPLHQLSIDITFYGLDMDAQGRAFPAISAIQSLPGLHVRKLTSRCHVCGACAPYTKRISHSALDSQYAVGGSESYQPACREHWL